MALETVSGEIVNEVAVTQPEKMEFKLINPTEDGFLRKITWNKDELMEAVKQKIEIYENVSYTEDNMKQAKADRAELNKLAKAIDDRRKMVKGIITEPYTAFEREIKEILEYIGKPVAIIDEQIKAFEDMQKESKRKSILEAYEEAIGDLADILPFEKLFDNRYLNQTYKLKAAQSEVRSKIEKVRTDLETIDSLESKYKINAKDVYIRTFDISRALAENKRLSDLEERLEAEKRRKAEEDECRKAEEENAETSEETSNAAESQGNNESVEKETLPFAEDRRSEPSDGSGTFVEPEEKKQEVMTFPKSEIGKTIQSIERQAYTAAVAQNQTEEKRYRAKFYVKGTKQQLERLIQFMDENGIEYGRINHE